MPQLRFSPLGAALSALLRSMHGFGRLGKWGVFPLKDNHHLFDTTAT